MKKITFLSVLFIVFFCWGSNAQITSFPYSEDFESGDGGWIVDGANPGTWALGTPAATIINSADSGTNAWVTNLTGNYNANENGIVVSPVFDLSTLSAPSIELSVWWNSEFSWDGMVLQSSVDDGTTWQNVGAVGDPNNWYNDGTIAGSPGGQLEGWTGRGATGSGGWVIARHALNGLGGQSSVILRVAFGSDGSVQDEGVAFDTVSIFDVSCPEPSGITVDNITDTSADITWTTGGSETNWEVAIQAAGSGVPVGSGTATPNNNPYGVMGLTAITDYEVWVRSDCGGEFSSWVGPINFSTLNTPPPAPVGVTCGSGSSSFVYTADYDGVDGWTGDINGGDGSWLIPGTSVSGGTGPDAAFSGANFMHYEASGGTTATASAVSPAIDLTTAVDGAELSFYMHAFGADMGVMNVGVSNSASGPFTTLFTWDGELQTDAAQAWVPIGINLDAYLGQTIYVEFSHTGTGGFEGDMSIDLMRVETCGTFCIAPSSIVVSNVGGTDADITWNGNNGETSWEYVVVPAGTGEPSGSGTTIGVTTVNETGLDFSTAYEFWVRADCGGGVFSLWSGPVNFTTTIQTDYTIDCTQAPTNITYCYGNNDTTSWVFTSSDGSPLRITFNSGTIEGFFDDLTIYEGTDNTGAILFNNNADGINDFTGLTFDSTGDSLFLEVDSDGSVSCESGARLEWDFTVACATCVNPAATYSVVSNCVVGPEFFIDVDVTDLGSATSLTVSDDQGSATQTVTAAGVVQFGPYANLTPVVITVANDDDANCEVSSSSLTQELCLDTVVDCTAGPVGGFLCYGNNDSVTLTYTSSDGNPLNLTINAGEIEGAPFDFLLVTDGNGGVLYQDEGNNGILDGLTFQSPGDTITIQILSDGSVSCESGSFCCSDGIDFTVSCATCINPAATYQVIDDCDNGQQFLIDVNVSTLGDATSLTISNNIDASTVPVTTAGVYQIGPFPFLVDVIVTVSNDQDANCVINSSPIQLLACPPDNDNPCDAIVVTVNTDTTCDLITGGTLVAATPSGVPNGSCPGNPDDDVWFQFVAENEAQVISIINIQGGTTNIDHAVYEGSCDGLTELFCSGDEFSFDETTYVVGNTYYVRVFSGGDTDETSTFDLCLRNAPENVDCEGADNPCIGGGDSGAFFFPSVVGIEPGPEPNDVACLGSAPNPSWFQFQVGESGLIEFQIEQYENFDDMGNPIGNDLDVDFVLWGPFTNDVDFCNLDPDLEVDCPSCPFSNITTTNFYPFGNIVDCSFDGSSIESFTIDNALAGEIYVLLVTNWSRDPGFIRIEQTNDIGGAFTAEIDVDLGLDQELCGFASYDIIATSPFADRYEWYCDGFIIDGEESSVLTVTESCTYTVIAFDDQCQAQAQDEITVTFGAEPVANLVDDIITCDDASGDEIEDFDLEIRTADVLGAQDAVDFNVTYHLTLAEAQQGINPLISPYTNISNPQTIFVRIEDVNADFCFATTSFDLIISGPTPTVNSVIYAECDDDFDGVTLFDLASQDGNVLGSQSATDFTVTYHETQADADTGAGAIDTSSLYSSATTTIFVRIESNVAFDCFSTEAIELIVDPLPDTSFTTNFDYEVCPDATIPILITATPNNYSESDVTINWYFEGGIISGENSLTLPVLEAGLYEIEVINNQTQCSSIVEQPVIELETCVIPQGISPNGDGSNDVFDLSSYGVTKLEIFNRNGTLVYSKRNYTNEWFGQSDDGDELPVGTYFYTMEYDNGKRRSAWVYIQRQN